MNVTLNLPLLKISNLKMSKGTLESDDYGTIRMWTNEDLQKVLDSITVAADMFFQSEIEINEYLVSEVGVDVDALTHHMVSQMFGDLHKVTAVQQHFEVRFDEIYPDNEPGFGAHTYTIEDEEYSAYFDAEVFEIARELHIDYMKNTSIMDVLGGDIENIGGYMNFIELKPFAAAIMRRIQDSELEDFVPDDAMFGDHKKLIMWMATTDEEFFLDNLERFFNYEKLAKADIDSLDEALTQLGNFHEHIFTDVITISNGEKKQVSVFKVY